MPQQPELRHIDGRLPAACGVQFQTLIQVRQRLVAVAAPLLLLVRDGKFSREDSLSFQALQIGGGQQHVHRLRRALQRLRDIARRHLQLHLSCRGILLEFDQAKVAPVAPTRQIGLVRQTIILDHLIDDAVGLVVVLFELIGREIFLFAQQDRQRHVIALDLRRMLDRQTIKAQRLVGLVLGLAAVARRSPPIRRVGDRGSARPRNVGRLATSATRWAAVSPDGYGPS